MTMPGHMAVSTKWTKGPTTFEFVLKDSGVTVLQDGKHLDRDKLTGSLAQQLSQVNLFNNIMWGKGIYGLFGGTSIKGNINVK